MHIADGVQASDEHLLLRWSDIDVDPAEYDRKMRRSE